MTVERAALGRLGEELAVCHLKRLGMRIVDRNWRCPSGELDVVAIEGDTVVICEVKTRSTDAFGQPVSAVGPKKAIRLRRLAALWLREQRLSASPVRFDVIGVLVADRCQPEIDHRRGVLG